MSQEEPQVEEPVVEVESVRTLIRPAAAEFLGCFFFIFISVGSAMNTVNFVSVGNIQIGVALTFGFTIFVLAFTIGHISGGHLNNAVTIAFVITQRITPLRGAMYFTAQMLGGLLGAAFLKWFTPLRFQAGCMASNMLGDDVTLWHGFGVEFMATFFLLLVVMAASDSAKSNTTLVPLAIGYAVTVAHLMAIPLTGCSINPMRSFASAFVSLGTEGCGKVWTDHWIFWIAPLLGATAGSVLYTFFFSQGGPINNLLNMYTRTAKIVSKAMFGPSFGAPAAPRRSEVELQE